MKEFFYFLFVFFLTLNVFARNDLLENFEYYRVYTNYNGSAYNGSSILVYGEGGVLVRTIDGGETWTQINLNDTFNITSAVNLGGDYFATTKTNRLIKSTDDGVNWKEYKLGEEIKTLRVAVYENSVYCLTDKSVIKLSRNLENLKNFLLESVSLESDLSVNDDYLVYAAGEGKLGVINLKTENETVLNMRDLGLCENCAVPYDLYNIEGKIYFCQNHDLYRYDINKDNSELIFHPIKSGNYAYSNGEIYELYNVFFTHLNLDSMYFVKIDEKTKTATSIKASGNDRYISELEFRDVSFISKDTVVAVGADKLIYFSYDGGQTWNLKSHFNCRTEHGDIVRFDKFKASRISDHAKFVKTTDGGTTWLPQKNYEPIFANRHFGDFLNYGTTYFKNSQLGFQFRVIVASTGKDTNFAYTSDGCETVKLKCSDGLSGYLDKDALFAITSLDTIMFIFPGLVPKTFYNYTIIYKLDESLDEVNRTVLDSAHIIFMDKFEDGALYAVTVNLKSPRSEDGSKIYDNRYCSLLKSNDNGYSWRKELDFWKGYQYKPQPLKSVGNNIFLSIFNNEEDTFFRHLYKLNVKTKNIEKIYSREAYYFAFNGVCEIDDKIYLIGRYFNEDNNYTDELLVNEDIKNNPTEWEALEPHDRYGIFVLFAKNDSLITIHSYDSLMQSQVVWFAKVKKGTSVNDISVNSMNTLYMSSPYPLPAKEKVKVRIWWDRRYNIKEADITVSNILGESVATDNQFTVNNINSYSGVLIWNFKDLGPGVYFITIKLREFVRSVPVIVSE